MFTRSREALVMLPITVNAKLLNFQNEKRIFILNERPIDGGQNTTTIYTPKELDRSKQQIQPE